MSGANCERPPGPANPGRPSGTRPSRPAAAAPLALCFAISLGLTACSDAGPTVLTLGVPTTVQDSGLLAALLPEFERAHPEYRVRYLAGGSGELLALGARGDVDVLLSHSPQAERAFVEGGHAVVRRRVMENEFVIVGPRADRAGLRGSDPATALARLAAAGALFVSRGDDSGTHRKELELWQASGAGARGAGYREAGEGMGAVLRLASELSAYALCDRATFLNLKEMLDLVILVEGDPRLRNIYSVIQVAGAREPEGARDFVAWITSRAGRRVIGNYGRARFGEALYKPTT